MNIMNSVTNNTQSYMPSAPPVISLPATPEQINTVQNHAYDAKTEKDAIEQSQKQSIWEAAVNQKYIESQKAAIEAYLVSATGESVYDNENQTPSITETYMNLKDFQESVQPSKLNLPQIPNDDVQIQPLNRQNEANVELYQTAQYERVNSLLHLMA